MKIYQVPKRTLVEPEFSELNEGWETGSGDEHAGYFYTLSKREAYKVFKNCGADPAVGDKITEINVAMNKYDIVAMLNQHASHPDNG